MRIENKDLLKIVTLVLVVVSLLLFFGLKNIYSDTQTNKGKAAWYEFWSDEEDEDSDDDYYYTYSDSVNVYIEGIDTLTFSRDNFVDIYDELLAFKKKEVEEGIEKRLEAAYIKSLEEKANAQNIGKKYHTNIDITDDELYEDGVCNH